MSAAPEGARGTPTLDPRWMSASLLHKDLLGMTPQGLYLWLLHQPLDAEGRILVNASQLAAVTKCKRQTITACLKKLEGVFLRCRATGIGYYVEMLPPPVPQNGQAVSQNGQAVSQNGQAVPENGQRVVAQNGQLAAVASSSSTGLPPVQPPETPVPEEPSAPVLASPGLSHPGYIYQEPPEVLEGGLGGETPRRAAAPPAPPDSPARPVGATPPRAAPRRPKAKGKPGENMQAFFDALDPLGCQRPQVTPAEASAYGQMIRFQQLTPAQIAGAWHHYRAHGSAFERQNLSMRFLLNNNRALNWVQDPAGVTDDGNRVSQFGRRARPGAGGLQRGAEPGAGAPADADPYAKHYVHYR